MLRPNESKFSLTLETKLLWNKLEREKRMDDFQTEFLKTFQGIVVRQTLKRKNLEPVRISMEKRPGDFMESLYIQGKTLT